MFSDRLVVVYAVFTETQCLHGIVLVCNRRCAVTAMVSGTW